MSTNTAQQEARRAMMLNQPIPKVVIKMAIPTIVAFLIIYEITKNRTKAVLTYGIFMLSPIFIVNSTLWAQCDMLPMFWVLLCIYFFVKERPSMAMFFFGVAFAFKLQPLWLAPMLVVLWVNKKVDLKHFLWLPFCYFMGILQETNS